MGVIFMILVMTIVFTIVFIIVGKTSRGVRIGCWPSIIGFWIMFFFVVVIDFPNRSKWLYITIFIICYVSVFVIEVMRSTGRFGQAKDNNAAAEEREHDGNYEESAFGQEESDDDIALTQEENSEEDAPAREENGNEDILAQEEDLERNNEDEPLSREEIEEAIEDLRELQELEEEADREYQESLEYECPYCGSDNTDGAHCFNCGGDF